MKPPKPATGRRQGRPTKLTAAVRERLLDLVRSGVASTRAAKMLGVHPDTVTDWCRVSPDFSDELEAARESSLGTLEQSLHRAGREDWRAALATLERRLPDEYGRKDRQEGEVSLSFAAILSQLDARRTEAAPSGQARSDSPAPKAEPARPTKLPPQTEGDEITARWIVRRQVTGESEAGGPP